MSANVYLMSSYVNYYFVNKGFPSHYFYCMDISQLFENVCVFNKRIKVF